MSKRTAAQQAAEPQLVETPLGIHLLGGFRVSVGPHPIPDEDWRLRKAANLVKLLALADNHRLHREQLIDLLWPDLDVKAAGNNLHHVLHNARRILHPGPAGDSIFLRLQQDQVNLGPAEMVHVDVQAFERAATQARGSRDPRACRSALSLYTGDLLPEDLYEDWTADRRVGLRGLHLALLLDLGLLYEQAADFGLAIDALQRAIVADPLCEDAHGHLMGLYARSGQRHQALRQFDQMKQLLERELDAQPSPSVQELYEQIVEGRLPSGWVDHDQAPAPPSDEGRRHNLPATLTSFVGREQEIAEIKRLLSLNRLVTITGAGGAGKTRLALQAAADVLDDYTEGVWLVELASISDPGLVALAVARAFDLQEHTDEPVLETVIGALRRKKILLVLDNCEHVIHACATFTEALLRSCALVKVLLTSREPLSIEGEVTNRVPPLSFPDPNQLPGLDQLLDCDSIRLFLERVQYRQPDFLLTPHNARTVAEICKQLDGIPLAIELAAARVGVLSVEQIAARLHDVLPFLTGGSRTAPSRHRTLRGALDWSYDLLTPSERTLLDRLSVFAGGWDLSSAEHISFSESRDSLETLELLSRLVDKSLVAVEAQSRGDVRYRLLEPVRQYAAERLIESGGAKDVEGMHLRLFSTLAHDAEAELVGPGQAIWLDHLEVEHDNLRKALAQAMDQGGAQLALSLGASLWRFWFIRGHLTEGRRQLEMLLTMSESSDDSIDPAVRAKAWNAAGALAYYQADFVQASVLYERALDLRREIGDKSGLARSLSNLGLVVKEQGNYSRAESFYLESLGLQRNLGDKLGVASALNNLGIAAQDQGDYERASELHRESLAIKRELQDSASIAYSLNNLGAIALERGSFGEAESLLQEGLALARDLRSKRSIVTALTNLGRLAREQGRYSEAARCYKESFGLLKELGERAQVASCLEATAVLAQSHRHSEQAIRLLASAESLRENMGGARPPSEEVKYHSLLLDLRHSVSGKAFDEAWAKGREMGQEEAIKYAMSIVDKRDSEQSPVLTPREIEIAGLIARGHTNREIATELTIALRTVDTHVTNILGKLGVESRAQVSDQMVQQEPV